MMEEKICPNCDKVAEDFADIRRGLIVCYECYEAYEENKYEGAVRVG